jgi:hypothetical protein
MDLSADRMKISTEEAKVARRFFDSRTIPDEVLTQFRRLAVQKVLPMAPTFGEWLRRWCEAEQYARKMHPDKRERMHWLGLPPLPDWTDREIGEALRGITIISLIDVHGSLSDFLDRLTLAISEEAADRLAKHE